MSLGVTLLGVDEVGELCGIADEEDRSVIEHPIPVTLICPELDRKATGITSGVGRTRLATDSREADGCPDLFTFAAKKRVVGEIAQILGDLEVSVGSCTLGVDLANTVRNNRNRDQVEPTTRSGILSLVSNKSQHVREIDKIGALTGRND